MDESPWAPLSLESLYANRWSEAQHVRLNRVWKVLVSDCFQPMISAQDRVLDIGCGFCHFLNNINAAEKVGVDANPAAQRHAHADVKLHCTDDLSLRELPDGHFDFVFISNFLEHLGEGQQILSLLRRVRTLLSSRGQLAILQPNFRLLGWRYFDFIDHKTILTDRNLQEALECTGFQITRKIVRFLPYSAKSRLPTHPLLVHWYLRCPPAQWLVGKQSLLIAAGRKVEF